jgi:hypothetical protein
MLVACRLACLSALEAHYEGVNAHAQMGSARRARRRALAAVVVADIVRVVARLRRMAGQTNLTSPPNRPHDAADHRGAVCESTISRDGLWEKRSIAVRPSTG